MDATHCFFVQSAAFGCGVWKIPLATVLYSCSPSLHPSLFTALSPLIWPGSRRYVVSSENARSIGPIAGFSVQLQCQALQYPVECGLWWCSDVCRQRNLNF